jgi:integrase
MCDRADPPPRPVRRALANRDSDARLFAESGADALRTAIAKACRAAAVPLFSPHDLRHRRVSLLHLRGVPWARIGEWVGQRNLAVTADTYTHVLTDEAELDYEALLA